MALQLYIGHSGRILPIDTSHTPTLDALRALISEHSSILPHRQILLTTKGRSVRHQTLLTESELFVFDSSLLSPSGTSTNPAAGQHLLVSDTDDGSGDGDGVRGPDCGPPDTLADQTSLAAWQGLFGARSDWAMVRREACLGLADAAQRCRAERAVIQRGLGVALESLRLHVRAADGKVGALAAWVGEIGREHDKRAAAWDGDVTLLDDLPARADFARFVRGADGRGGRSTLRGFLGGRGETLVRDAGIVVDGLRVRVKDIRAGLIEAQARTETLLSACEQVLADDTSSLEESMEPGRLMEEIDILLRKITSDEKHIGALPRTAQSVSQASKIALLHTRNFLPNLVEYAAEMHELRRKTARQRKQTAESCAQLMQDLSRVEGILAKVYADVKVTVLSEDQQLTLNSLNVAARLPHVYGSLLIEALRRREWTTKMRRDSSTLAEEIAVYQKEESGRRRKWLDSIDDVVRPESVESVTMGIEVNLQSEGEDWPSVTRTEIRDYIGAVSQLGVPTVVTTELSQAFRALDQPTRRQVRHARAFRDGSLHEAALGSTSLLVRGEDEHKVLRDANTRLTDELRGQKSRVRKLEDLLHRQTSASRVVIGEVFSPQVELSTSRPTSPSPTLGIRRISEDFRPGASRSRRTSSHQEMEEKKLARRVVLLEAELHNAREAASIKDRQARDRADGYEAVKVKVEEAEAVKRDIMRNMEAQQREFVEERRGWESDLTGARARIEELEDELDRLLDSTHHGNTRVGLVEQEKTRLEGDLATLKADLEAERDRSRIQEGRLADLASSRDGVEAEVKTLRAELERRSVSDAEVGATMSATYTLLGPGRQPPPDRADLALELEELVRRSVDHVNELNQAVAVAKAENETMRHQHEALGTILDNACAAKTGLESDLRMARERHSAEVERGNSLSSQLESERQQLKLLRGKFAEGETGAGALRQRVEDQDSRVGRLSEELAQVRSHGKSLEEELDRLQEELDATHERVKQADYRLLERGRRAKDVTYKLYAQNMRLFRLLDALGFAVTHKDGQMMIERASKVTGAASTNLGETTQSLVKVGASPSTPTAASVRKASDPQSDASTLAFLQWSETSSAEGEAASFESLLSNLSTFSTDAFSDALSKRLRDFEYTARKFRLESRSASVRAAKATQTATSKLAVRDFREGDLALFLPTKGKSVGAWAAFNINAPHHFLREREGMNLSKREWLVARITRVEERTVDLSASLSTTKADDGKASGATADPERDTPTPLDMVNNPFDLSPGLTWYLVHAHEDRGHAAPATPGPGKVTVQGNMESARATVSRAVTTPPVFATAAASGARVVPGRGGAAVDQDESDSVKGLKATLGRSLESRRSSAGSAKRTAAMVLGVPVGIPGRDDARSPDSSTAPAFETKSASAMAAGMSLLSAALGRASMAAGGDGVDDAESRPQRSMVPSEDDKPPSTCRTPQSKSLPTTTPGTINTHDPANGTPTPNDRGATPTSGVVSPSPAHRRGVGVRHPGRTGDAGQSSQAGWKRLWSVDWET